MATARLLPPPSRSVDDLVALPITRFPVGPSMVRAFALRADIAAHDACDIALAEALDCPLITADRRLANAPMATCGTEVLER